MREDLIEVLRGPLCRLLPPSRGLLGLAAPCVAGCGRGLCPVGGRYALFGILPEGFSALCGPGRALRGIFHVEAEVVIVLLPGGSGLAVADVDIPVRSGAPAFLALPLLRALFAEGEVNVVEWRAACGLFRLLFGFGGLEPLFELLLGEAAEVGPWLLGLFLLLALGLLEVKGQEPPVLFLLPWRGLGGNILLRVIGTRRRAGAYAEDLFELDLFSGRRRGHDEDVLALGAPYLHTVASYAGIVEAEFCGAFIAFYYHLSPLLREFTYL